jgi:hypothetical protein
VDSPSARPWLGVGAALSALPAAGGCFCAALVLAVVADSDPGAVYEQHRWLGAIVAASAVCAFVAMMGWATLRHGGLPASVLLIALAVSGAPFLLPRGLFLPAAALAVAGCAALATAGLLHPPGSPDGTRLLTGALAGAAVVLAISQAIGVGMTGATPAPRARVLADTPHTSHPMPARTDRAPAREKPGRKDRAPAREKPGRKERAPAREPDRSAVVELKEPAATPAPPVIELKEPAVATAPPAAAPDPAAAPAPDPVVAAAARAFVRNYYAALDGKDFAAAWQMLSPDVQHAFGGFAAWRKGYARTVSNAPGGVTVTPAAAGATVGLTLRAGDRGACGRIAERRFAVTWRLARTSAGWRATAASARKLSGPEPC